MNDVALAGQVLTSPTAAFTELRERPRFLLLLSIVVIATALQMVWYYNAVDIEWLKDHLFSGNARMDSLPPEARERFMSAMTKNTLMWPSVIAITVMMPAVFALLSAYYLLAGKVTNVQHTFKQWFALNVWCSLPMLIGLAAGSAILLMAGAQAQVGPSELQVLSLNELFFKLTPAHPGAQLLSQINPITVWSWCLSIIAIKTWSNRTWLFSAVFVLLPVALIYGVWAWAVF